MNPRPQVHSQQTNALNPPYPFLPRRYGLRHGGLSDLHHVLSRVDMERREEC